MTSHSLHHIRTGSEGDFVFQVQREVEQRRIDEDESHADDGDPDDEWFRRLKSPERPQDDLEAARACVDLERRIYGEYLR